MKFVEFRESGVRFEIQGPLPNGEWLVLAVPSESEGRAFEEPTWDDVCRRVDQVMGDQGSSYAGYLVDIWRHEGWIEQAIEIRTRGSLLLIFDEGEDPSVEELRDQLECAGDIVLEVRDGSGNVLLDCRSEARERIDRMSSLLP